MAQNDPIEALGLGLAADHQAEKKRRGRKSKADTAETPSDDASATAAPETAEQPAPEPAEPVTEAEPAKPETTEVPPAPGDDRESVMERRFARLLTIAEDAAFDGGTLFGDVRDCMIDLFQHRPKLWAAMTPSEQKDTIRHVESVVKVMIERVVLVVAEEDSRTLAGTLQPGFTVKGEGAELKIKLDHVNGDVLLDAFNMAGQKVVVIDAADRRFMSQRRAHDIGDDQLDMAFASDPKPIAPPEDAGTVEPQHPADDSDLAGEDTPSPSDPAVVEDSDVEDEGDGDARYRIKSRAGEYLIDADGGDDGWTANVTDAGSWPQEEADHLVDEFGGADVVELELVVDTPADD